MNEIENPRAPVGKGRCVCERRCECETNGRGDESVLDWMMVVAVVGMAIFRTSRQRTTSRSPRQRFSVGRWLKRRLSDKSAPNSREFLLQPDSPPLPLFLQSTALRDRDRFHHVRRDARWTRGRGKKISGGVGRTGAEKRNAGNRASGSGKLIRIIENVTNLSADCWLISRVPDVSNFSIFQATLRLSFHKVNN